MPITPALALRFFLEAALSMVYYFPDLSPRTFESFPIIRAIGVVTLRHYIHDQVEAGIVSRHPVRHARDLPPGVLERRVGIPRSRETSLEKTQPVGHRDSPTVVKTDVEPHQGPQTGPATGSAYLPDAVEINQHNAR